MKSIIIFLSVLLIAWPRNVNAGHNLPSDRDLSLIFGTIITSGSAIIFPLVGLAFDDREHSPYWRAVGFTFVASESVVLIAAFSMDERGNSGTEILTNVIVLPAVFGAVATFLSYKYLPRQTDKSTSALWHYAPQVSVSPVGRGGSIRLNWTF